MGKGVRPLFALCVLAVLLLFSCGGEPEELVYEPGDDKPVSRKLGKLEDLAQELRDVRFSQSKGGKLQWELQAESVEQIASGPTSLKNIKITYYGEEGKITELTAEFGTYDSAKGDVGLRKNVVVNTSDGDKLKTDSLKWNQEKEMLIGEGQVMLSRGNSIIKGKGFMLLPAQETVKIYQVEGVVNQGDFDEWDPESAL